MINFSTVKVTPFISSQTFLNKVYDYGNISRVSNNIDLNNTCLCVLIGIPVLL